MTDSEWQDAWKDFFNSVAKLISAKAERLAARPSIQGFITAQTPALIDSIQSDLPAVLRAVNSFKDGQHPELEVTLYNEIKAITEANNAVASSPSVEALDQALDDSDTGKGSIEELLGNWLPDWLKKLLKILNQIISLVKG
jgi:hypothetical protein